MGQKGGKFDASGQPIGSWRIVTDTDADTGIGSQADPMRVDPTGTTVQPVSFSGPVTVTGGLTDTQLRASAVPVSVGSIALPTGASTEATLLAAKVDLDTLAGTVSASKVAISAASLPLPTGAALDATLTGGTAKARITGNAGATVDSTVGAGTAPTNQVVVGTIRNTTAPAPTTGQALALQSDAAGSLYTSNEGRKPTYVSFASAFTPPATPSDVWTLQGDGTKVLRLVRLTILAHATAAAAPIFVIVTGRTSLDTGGTSASPSVNPIDPADAAIGTVATINRYTVNPAGLGVGGGTSFVGALPVNASGGTTQVALDITFGGLPGAKLPTINTNVQQIALNFQAAVLPAGFGIDFIFGEFTVG